MSALDEDLLLKLQLYIHTISNMCVKLKLL